MRKFIFFISVLVLLLGIPAVVKAKPPEDIGPLATIVYVDSKINALKAELITIIGNQINELRIELKDYVDKKIAGIGGGGGEDFNLPVNWNTSACANCAESIGPKIRIQTPSFDINDPKTFCNWHGVNIGADVKARAIAYLPEEPSTVLGYATGQCISTGIVFDKFVDNVPFPEQESEIPVHIWFEWMGIKKEIWVNVPVVEPGVGEE